MIITAPLRRMILHRSQRGLTEVRIFMRQSSERAARHRAQRNQPP